MCWFPEDWNYHPSLPMKRLQQIDDVVAVKADVLLWSCLGGAAIALQYLDREANEAVAPRLRFYGFVNDKEFCDECRKRGITAYGVLFRGQLWEFPAELDESGSTLVALNKLRGAGDRTTVGVRELSVGSLDGFRPIDDYFPDGLRNSDGVPVDDFLAEFQARTLDGTAVRSEWLHVPGHAHVCYTPCPTNEAYVKYQKKAVELMIDAGPGGLMIDEIDMNVHMLYKSGCFCRDCMRGFRRYLSEHPSVETAALDLTTFDYGDMLRSRGYGDADLDGAWTPERAGVPLFRAFTRYNLERMEAGLEQVFTHARDYSRRTRGAALPIAANLYNCLPHVAVLRKHCDLIIGERSGTQLRQEGFYRYGYAFLGGKPGLFIEDPSPHILQIVDDLKHGRTDTYLLFMLEPLSQGFTMAIPYGAWLINLVKDAFYADMDAERELGAWLEEHRRQFVPDPVGAVGLVYDWRSALEVQLFEGGYVDPAVARGFDRFHDLAQALCDEHVLYEVVYVSEDDPLSAERLAPYEKLILPDVFSLPAPDTDVLENWRATRPGALVTVGRAAPQWEHLRPSGPEPRALAHWAKERGQTVDVVPGPHSRHVGLGLHRAAGGGYFLHLVNYWLDEASRTVRTIPRLEIDLARPATGVTVTAFPPSAVEVDLDGTRLQVRDLGLYTVLEIR